MRPPPPPEPDIRKMTYVGSFDSSIHHLTIPNAVIKPIVARLDAEQKRREREVERARLRVMQDARARAKLSRALHAVFRSRRRSR
jgi:dephospho-CoA kinase